MHTQLNQIFMRVTAVSQSITSHASKDLLEQYGARKNTIHVIIQDMCKAIVICIQVTQIFDWG